MKTVRVPVNQVARVMTDNSQAKADAIKNSGLLFKQEKELRAMVEKEYLDKKIRTRRKFDEIHQH
jgi:hypothetical protein